MFDIEIPRDPDRADGYVTTTRLWLTNAEHQILAKVSDTLGTLPQVTVALLHEGFTKWSIVCEELGAALVVEPTVRGAQPIRAPALDPRGVSRAYGALAADVPTVDPLIVAYRTQLPPVAFGDSRERVEAQLRDEVRMSCAVAIPVLAYEKREQPVGLLMAERGFVEIPWPFLNRFFGRHSKAPVGELFDASALDSPNVFRHGLEF